MDSFALAYIPSNSDDSSENKEHFSVKVNINLWTQCGWDDETPVLDIGLMLYHLSEAKKVKLYIPFHIEKGNLEDLCECLSNDANLLGAVFNEPSRSADVAPGSKQAEVMIGGDSKKTEFILYRLDFLSDSDVQLSSYKESRGTFLEFNPQFIKGNQNEVSCDQYYLRFRIRTPSLKECVREYKAPNRYFETLVNSTYMVDIRFNNTRSMDCSLLQELTAQDRWSLAPINGLHFLLMAKVDVDVDAKFDSSRVLEKDIWNKYVNPNGKKKRKTEDIIAYHSSKKLSKDTNSANGKRDIGSWEFFARLKAGKCSPMTIIPYVLLLVLLNVISNLTFNILLALLPQEALKVSAVCVQFIALAVLIALFLIALLLLNKKNPITKLTVKLKNRH